MVGWYTKSSRFIFDALGRHHYKTSAFRSNSRIPQNLVYHDNVLKQQSSPFADGGKRFYSGEDRRRIKHPVISALTMAGCVVVVGVEILRFYERSLSKPETVPYTNRRQFLLLSISQEQQTARSTSELIKSKFKGRILAPHDPMSIRAQKIGNDIVEVVKSQNAHLNEFEWEFVVFDDPAITHPADFPAGKIVVPSGLLNRFRGDDEVAAFIAIAVGHVVARHFIEDHSNCVRQRHSVAVFRLILSPFYDSGEAERLFMLPARRSMEMEADYIGLILMAAAGYDPRVAPRLWKQLGSKNPLDDFFSLHPCGKTRAQRLSQPGVMEEALSMYREARAQRGIEAE